MPLPIDARKKPTDVKVHVSSGAGVDVTWSDGHTSHYDFAYLREWCPCAMCNEERRKKDEAEQKFAAAGSEASAAGGSTGSAAGSIGGFGSAALPIFKPKARAKSAKAVGNYALQIEFTDGHSTGIYSFTYLREVCPCDECTREFRG